jgi:hypothetical protein
MYRRCPRCGAGGQHVELTATANAGRCTAEVICMKCLFAVHVTGTDDAYGVREAKEKAGLKWHRHPRGELS